MSPARYELAIAALKADVSRLAHELAVAHTDYRSKLEQASVENSTLRQQLSQRLTSPLASSSRVQTQTDVATDTAFGQVTSYHSDTDDGIDEVNADLDKVSRELEASRRELTSLRKQIREDIQNVRSVAVVVMHASSSHVWVC